MNKLKKLLTQSDQVQIISKDDAEKLKGGGYEFLYRGHVGICGFFCNGDDDDQ